MSTDKAKEVRSGLLDSVAGKAKEVAGALTGNSELADEGQLQQAGAQARKDARSREAVADAREFEAGEELRRHNKGAATAKRAAIETAAQRERIVQETNVGHKIEAETRAARQEQAERHEAETQADRLLRDSLTEAFQLRVEAASTARTTEKHHDRLEAEADDAARLAAQLRAETQSE